MSKQETLDELHELIRKMPFTPMLCILDELEMKTEAKWYVKNRDSFREKDTGPFKTSDRAEKTLRTLKDHIFQVNNAGSEISGANHIMKGHGLYLKHLVAKAIRQPECSTDLFEVHYPNRLKAYQAIGTGEWPYTVHGSVKEQKIHDISMAESLLLRQAIWRAYSSYMISAPLPETLGIIHVPSMGWSFVTLASAYSSGNPLDALRDIAERRLEHTSTCVMATPKWPDIMGAVAARHAMRPEIAALLCPQFDDRLLLKELIYRYKLSRCTEADLMVYPHYIKDLDSDELEPYVPISVGF